ncbi:MAG: hypothetical protein WDN04_12190 [Rhodospirillales bacterium]
MLETARAIGLVRAGTLVLDSDDEITLVLDLCLHAARPGRSRAIDRLAHASSFAAGSDEAVVMAAMQRARFSIWRVVRHYEAGGLVLEDTLRGGEAWLMDEGMSMSAEPDFQFVGRLCRPDMFVISTGVMVPFDTEVGDEMAERMTPALHALAPSALADDYRFAQLLYRACVVTNAMEGVVFLNTPMAA